MDIKWKCDGCGQPAVTDSKYAGEELTCPTCNKRIVIPKKSALDQGNAAPPKREQTLTDKKKQYEIEGVDAKTGTDRTLTVEAGDESGAVALAKTRGVFPVKVVQKAQSSPPQGQAQVKRFPAPEEKIEQIQQIKHRLTVGHYVVCFLLSAMIGGGISGLVGSSNPLPFAIVTFLVLIQIFKALATGPTEAGNALNAGTPRPKTRLNDPETDDCRNTLKRYGFSEEDFEIVRKGNTPPPGVVYQETDVVQIKHKKSGISKTYPAGYGSFWPADFAMDLENGVFPKTERSEETRR